MPVRPAVKNKADPTVNHCLSPAISPDDLRLFTCIPPETCFNDKVGTLQRCTRLARDKDSVFDAKELDKLLVFGAGGLTALHFEFSLRIGGREEVDEQVNI